jgi:hypothetical protein
VLQTIERHRAPFALDHDDSEQGQTLGAATFCEASCKLQLGPALVVPYLVLDMPLEVGTRRFNSSYLSFSDFNPERMEGRLGA